MFLNIMAIALVLNNIMKVTKKSHVLRNMTAWELVKTVVVRRKTWDLTEAKEEEGVLVVEEETVMVQQGVVMIEQEALLVLKTILEYESPPQWIYLDSVIPRNRFQTILQSLQFADNSQLDPIHFANQSKTPWVNSWMNSPILSLLLPLWQNKSLSETIGMKICVTCIFIRMKIKPFSCERFYTNARSEK